MRHVDRLGNARMGTALLAGLMMLISFTALAADGIGSDPEIREQKTYWQTRYRQLLSDRQELQALVARERELYADANRRNYRRGDKRHVHRDAMLEAQDQLAEVERALSTIRDDARRAGALPGWLNEVEFEFEESRERPAITAGPGDEGRNPLYLDPETD